MENKSTYTSGISATSLLGIVFIVLKLCGIINWSWLWVLAPFWIPFAITIIILTIVVIISVFRD